MNYFIGAAVVVLGLVVSIALHEIGHLIPAKRYKVPVSQYMVGFGPTLWSKKRGETEYGIKAIPLGGYVRILGMFKPPKISEASESSEVARRRGWWQQNVQLAKEEAWAELKTSDMQQRAFYRLPVRKKLAVMFGGPLMNLLLAGVLMVIAYSGIGIYEPSTTVASLNQCVSNSGEAECSDEDPAGPAYAAGIEPGDEIVAINGQEIDTWEQLQETVSVLPAQPQRFEILRDGQSMTVDITPLPAQMQRLSEDGETVVQEVSIIGAYPSFELTGQPISRVPTMMWQHLSLTAQMVTQLPQRVFEMGEVLVTDKPRDDDGVLGVVGVVRVAGEITSLDDSQIDPLARVGTLLELLASLNIALFVFNMIPLLPLDGGHIFGALYEGVRNIGRKRESKRYYFDTAQLLPLAYIVFSLLVLAGLVIILADIFKPVTIT